jgi:hypothetical protein
MRQTTGTRKSPGEKLVKDIKRAPKIKDDRASAEDVSTKGISEDASEYDP